MNIVPLQKNTNVSIHKQNNDTWLFTQSRSFVLFHFTLLTLAWKSYRFHITLRFSTLFMFIGGSLFECVTLLSSLCAALKVKWLAIYRKQNRSMQHWTSQTKIKTFPVYFLVTCSISLVCVYVFLIFHYNVHRGCGCSSSHSVRTKVTVQCVGHQIWRSTAHVLPPFPLMNVDMLRQSCFQ